MAKSMPTEKGMHGLKDNTQLEMFHFVHIWKRR